MHSQITAYLRSRGNQLLSGQTDALVLSYIYPLPVFLPQQRLVLQGPEEARYVFQVLRNALVRGGIVALNPQVVALELPRAGRYRLWVDWQEIAHHGGVVSSSSAVYYCRATPLGPMIEMVNYTHLSMPELNQQFQALALSA